MLVEQGFVHFLLLATFVAFAKVFGIGAAHLPADVVAEVGVTEGGFQEDGEFVGDAGKPVAGVFQLSEEARPEAAVLGVGDGREDVVVGAQAELKAVKDVFGGLVSEHGEVVSELVCQPLPAACFSRIIRLLVGGVPDLLGALEKGGAQLLDRGTVAEFLVVGQGVLEEALAVLVLEESVLDNGGHKGLHDCGRGGFLTTATVWCAVYARSSAVRMVWPSSYQGSSWARCAAAPSRTTVSSDQAIRSFWRGSAQAGVRVR
ncbi:hypothetical protein SAMN05428954_0013 [Streptomyces sp. 2112.3]|uniref:hypothetical protein n=1 Tax=Streptomyces sp. 2112.3 TaxID=1881023 RepID=UPI000898A7E1|nr:hypothetical protein [Streptomyces sp. 2112.3]SED28653.1 hypothetical protein SAMN05428954_0013 [Streptomyces sp. 2112.3]